MSDYRIFLSPPYQTGKELAAVAQVMDTNWLAPVGPALDEFEMALERLTGTNHAVALQSGTAALHLSMKLLGIGPGDEVLVSTFTHNATVNAIVYTGATPVLIDSEQRSWNMDLDLLEEAIQDRMRKGKKPGAILVVHLYGNPMDMNRLMAISQQYEIPVVEDAAEALGSTWQGQHVGTFGVMGILSFNGNKIITTTGGGALLTNNRAMAEKALYLATQARDSVEWFEHQEIGYNYRLSNLLAAFGLGQLAGFEKFLQKRISNFDKYNHFFHHHDGIGHFTSPTELPGGISNRWLSVFAFEDVDLNKRLMQALKSQAIEARYLWKPMHLQPVFSAFPNYGNGISDQLFDTGICLPSGYALSDGDFEKIFEVLAAINK
jgi:dTDP-4-amino-4,6-dideoxygalactose transaminase